MHRVVITGIGSISALGVNMSASWDTAVSGECRIGELKLDAIQPLKQKLAGQIRDYNPEEHFSRSDQAIIDRFHSPLSRASYEAATCAGGRVVLMRKPRIPSTMTK